MPTLELRYRITTFAPPSNVAGLVDGVTKVHPLGYGKYTAVAWWSAEGVEQFRASQDAKPTKGMVGQLEQLPSVKIEFTVPRDDALLSRVLDEAGRGSR